MDELKICRICHVNVQVRELYPLDEKKLNQLNFLANIKTVDFNENHLICKICSYNLEENYNFKSKSLKNLNEIIEKDNSVKSGVNCFGLKNEIKKEIEELCLTCLKYSDVEELFFINNNLPNEWFVKDLLLKCIPEINFSLIPNLFICMSCVKSLQNQFNFMVSCFDCETFNDYSELENIDVKEMEINSLNVVKRLNKPLENLVHKKEDLEIKEEIEMNSDIEMEDDANNEDESRESPSRKLNKKLYSCKYCLYKNHKRANLNSHLLVHEKQKPQSEFKCDFCEFKTKWRSSLLTHKLLHKNNEELITFQCYHCCYETKHKKHLRRHMKIHRTILYFCKNCTYKTKTESRLEVHKCHPNHIVKKLTSEIRKERMKLEASKENSANREEYKPDIIYEYFSKITELNNDWYYLCKTCSYRTVKMSSIKEHVLTHLRVREAKCHLCDYSTKYKKTLKTHINKMHS